MTKIKICGITNIDDAVTAANLGADMLGFVFYKKSKRYIEPHKVREIVNELPPSIGRVGVFVDEDADAVRDIAVESGLNMLQFHGDEAAEYCRLFNDYKTIKAFRIKDRLSLKGINAYDVDYYMLDTYSEAAKGGTGKSFDWKIVTDFEFLRPIILSGGLTVETIARAIQEVAPYGVDVSSGVEERPGKKDIKLMTKFIDTVRRIG
jgi:phosphoribosylanthranilate isomerase